MNKGPYTRSSTGAARKARNRSVFKFLLYTYSSIRVFGSGIELIAAHSLQEGPLRLQAQLVVVVEPVEVLSGFRDLASVEPDDNNKLDSDGPVGRGNRSATRTGEGPLVSRRPDELHADPVALTETSNLGEVSIGEGRRMRLVVLADLYVALQRQAWSVVDGGFRERVLESLKVSGIIRFRPSVDRPKVLVYAHCFLTDQSICCMFCLKAYGSTVYVITPLLRIK